MTLRLAHWAGRQWDVIDGYAVSRNMPRLERLPLDRFAHFIWWFLTRNGDADEVEKLRGRVWRPPLNDTAPIPAKSPWSAESETSGFAALRAGLSGTAPRTGAEVSRG